MKNTWYLVLLLAGGARAADLSLDLTGVAPGKGEVMVALYDSADHFLHKPLRRVAVPASDAALRVKLADLAPGEYAVSLYQDVNGNKKMDTHMFGIPAEPYGFSNNAEGSFGPPKFDAAKVALPADGRTIAIALHK